MKNLHIASQDALCIDDAIENIHAAQDCRIASIHCIDRNIVKVTQQLIHMLGEKDTL